MMIQDYEIERIVNVHQNYHVGHQYYINGNVTFMEIVYSDEHDEYNIDAKVSVFGYISHVMMIMNGNFEVISYGCNCRYCSQQSACGHIAAVLFVIQEQQPIAFPYVYDSEHLNDHQRQQQEIAKAKQRAKQDAEEVYRQQLEEQRWASEQERRRAFHEEMQKRMQEEDDQRKKQRTIAWLATEKARQLQSLKLVSSGSYRIEIGMEEVSAHDSYLGDGLKISMRVGNHKLYVVKNFDDFFSALKAERTVSYGKGLSFVHSYAAFDEVSQRLLTILEKNHTAYYSQYYGRCGSKMMIRGCYVDELFQLLEEDIDEWVTFSHRKEDFIITIHISKENSRYVIALDTPKRLTNMMLGDAHFYMEKDGVLICKALDDEGKVMRLYKQLKEENFIIEEADIQEFGQYILNDCKAYLKIKGSRLLPVIRCETLLQVYADIDERGMVNLTIDYYFDDCKYQGFTDHNTMTTANLEIVENYIRQYADVIDYDKHTAYMDSDKETTILFLQEGMEVLRKYADIYISDALKRRNHLQSMDISVGVRITNDLLQMDVESVDFSSEELQDILKAYRRKRKYYRLQDGNLLNLESEELKEVNDMMEQLNADISDLKEGHLALPVYRSLYLNEKIEEDTSLHFACQQTYQNYIDTFMDTNIVATLPPHYETILRDYQKTGFHWMKHLQKFHFGGILADDMGLGKTLQVIALLDSEQSPQHCSLVVAPSSLLLNWKDEIHKFSKELACCCIMGNAQERRFQILSYATQDVMITSYEYLRRDIEEYKDITFHYVILDEAQYIKNQKTKNAMSVKKLQATYRLALSGTPIENSLAELWSIFDFLLPGYLYNYQYFQSYFEKSIVNDRDEAKQHRLKKMVEPFILRRKKKEVLQELPDKIETTLTLSFSKEERKLYVANLAQVNKQLQAKLAMESMSKPIILSMLTKLRQICCEPRVLYENIQETGSKLKGCMELIQSLRENHQRILLFSSFTSVLDMIAQELNHAHIRYQLLTGSTDKTQRHKLVQEFQNGVGDVFLISLKAGGTGLNLTAAQAVIHYDPWWNVSAQNQATDRAHRIGQTSSVSVYKLIMDESIEQKILELQEQKKNLADAFVEGNDGVIQNMTMDEIMNLFQPS